MTEPQSLAVARLTLQDFRCYRHLRLETDPRPVVLTGPNGGGKTNILEALSFLSPGRGLRRARIAEVTRRAAGPDAPWAVAARLRRPDGEIEVGTGRDNGSDRRLVRIDGRAAKSQAALAEVVNAVWLTPGMDRLFQEGAAGRRRFLDRLVYGLDAAHAGRAAGYERAMRERSRLLRQPRPDAAWLAALEERMAEAGIAMAVARRRAVAEIAAATRAGAGVFPAAEVAVEGTVEAWLAEVSAEEATERFRAALAQGRRQDAQAGGAGTGPHRSDLRVRHVVKGMAAEACSTGEQKALLIALVLAQARLEAGLRGMAPLLLLDEVVAHLDEERRRALFAELESLGTQMWLTGTDVEPFAPLGAGAQYFRVEDATVTPQG